MIRSSHGSKVLRRFLIGALALLIPVLAGCEAGNNAPTLEFHPAAAGAYGTAGAVTVDNAWTAAAYVDLGNSGSGNLNVDCSLGSRFRVILTGNVTEPPVICTDVAVPGALIEVSLSALPEPLYRYRNMLAELPDASRVLFRPPRMKALSTVTASAVP